MTRSNREAVPDETAEASGVGSLFSHVVCGVDSSEISSEAVRQAVRLAPARTELTLVAVSEAHIAVHAGMLAAKASAEVNADAEQALASAGDIAIGARSRLIKGRAAEALLRVLTEERATLVCVGSHDTVVLPACSSAA